MSYTITVAGYQDALGAIKGLPEKLEHTVILRMSQVAYDTAESGADAHTQTGVLRGSLYNRAIDGGRSVGHDPQEAPYAVAMIFGYPPMRIFPSTKKALRWPNGNGFLFAKWVDHPGWIGDDWLGRARDDALSEFQNILAGALEEHFNA